MIILNLLSPEEKKKVQRIRLYHLIKNLSFQLTSVVLITMTVLIFNYLLLANQNESLDQQIENEVSTRRESRITSIEEATKQLNTQLESSKTVLDLYVQWTSILAKISNEIPAGITLTSVQLDSASLSFRIAGVALDRSLLLNFQDVIANNAYFTNTTSPISNLTQKDNVTFEITGQLTNAIYD